jgi:hypothetical protein
VIIDVLFLFGVAAVLAAAVVLLCKHPLPGAPYALVGCVGLFSLAMSAWSAFPFLVDVGHHNFIYTSLGYAAGRSFPPENPFAAGMPPNFPWIAFAIYTELAKLLDTSPGWMAKIVGVVCSLIAVWAVCTLVKVWSPKPYRRGELGVAAVCLSLLAGTIFWGSFPKLGINPALHPLYGGWWESRASPSISCFFTPTFPIGLSAAVAAYACLIASFVRGLTMLRGAVILVGAASSAVYPFAWLGLGLAVAGASVAALLLRVHKRSLFGAAALLSVGACVGYLYVKSLRPDGSQGAMALDLSVGEIIFEARLLLLYQGVLLLLCAHNWRFFRDQLREGTAVPFLIVGSLVAINCATLAVRFLDHTDYKLWALSTMLLGVLAAPTLCHAVRRAPLATALVLAVLMFPLSRSLWEGSLALRKISPALVVAVEGGQLRLADPERQAPYDWLAANTPTDAVVVERGTTWAPVFANRSIFIGRHAPKDVEPLFGFQNPIHIWLADYCGFGAQFVSQRLDLVDSLFGLDGASEVVATITHQVNGRPVFLLARTVDESVALNTLAGQRVVTKVAEGDNWIIARLNTP